MTHVFFAQARRRRARAAAPPTVERFAPEVRPAIARLASRDARLRDLAGTFPALLHRLAVQPRTARTQRSIAVVLDGGSLKAAAFAAGLPLWTRRLEPEAFGVTAPELPGGFWFSRRVANALPASRRAARGWLAAVAEAARWGDDEAVLWAARESGAQGGLTPEEARLVALFAWFAARRKTPGGALAGEGFAPELGVAAAIGRARVWLRAIELFLALGDRTLDPWLEGGAIDGFDFVPVASRTALVEEAGAMKNCLGSYGYELAGDYERVFSVRKSGERVASVSVRFLDDAPFPQLSELKGPENAAASPEVWFAARRWLSDQAPKRPEPKLWDACLDRAAWIAVWRPWWLARRRLPPELPLGPSAEALGALFAHRPYRRRRRRRA